MSWLIHFLSKNDQCNGVQVTQHGILSSHNDAHADVLLTQFDEFADKTKIIELILTLHIVSG